MPEDRDNPGGTRVPPPLVFAAGALFGLGLHGIFPVRFLPRRAAPAVGLGLISTGAALALWFGRTMRRAGAPFRLDEPTERLVTGGPFRLSRNPGYLAFAVIQGGIACGANALWALLLVPATLTVVQHRVVRKEEAYLERRFGEEHLRYKRRVRRWL